MTIDLMIVDDEEELLNGIEGLAKLSVVEQGNLPKLEIIKFISGVEALNYLRGYNNDLPRGYVVDMRIPGGLEELESSEKIYWFLEKKGLTKYFKFHTGRLSDHDKRVQEATGAEVLIKGNSSEKLRDLFVELARTKKPPK